MAVRKLEIGSGTRPEPGYEHADVNRNLPDLQHICEMWAIPVEDNAFDEVRSVHVIEHAPRNKWLDTLKEWHRILKPGGMMHADTPNLGRNAELYRREGDEWLTDFYSLTPGEQEACSLGGVPNRCLWYNFKSFSSHHEHDIHYGNFDADLLVDMCKQAGFALTEVYQINPSLIVRAWKA
jgi:SAM-dependent methyltransferase